VYLLLAITVKTESFRNSVKLVVVGGNESGPTVETLVKEIKKVHPKMDIAQEKPQKQQEDGMGQLYFPPG
jgi:hypothetical protein